LAVPKNVREPALSSPVMAEEEGITGIRRRSASLRSGPAPEAAFPQARALVLDLILRQPPESQSGIAGPSRRAGSARRQGRSRRAFAGPGRSRLTGYRGSRRLRTLGAGRASCP